jgi:geranylgeranyl diphosphate synthase type I
VPTTIDERLPALTAEIDGWIRPYVQRDQEPASRFYQMMAYHLGWLDAEGTPLASPAIGKRIRPALVVLTCEALGGPTNAARGPAIAVELIHNFSLVHDDIQDRSDERHGRDTVWKLWGGAQGINVGDAIYALAQVALAEQSAEHPAISAGVLRLNRTCVRLCEGQYLDMALETAADVTLATYEQMIARKTAALIECSTALGAWAAGAPPDVVEACGRFGHELGIAYQFQDDLLGVWGDPAITGKPNRADVRSRKKALPMVLTLAMASGSGREFLLDALKSPDEPDDATIERMVRVMESAGVREHAAEMVDLRFDTLDRAIRAALPASASDPILDLCARLRVRDY